MRVRMTVVLGLLCVLLTGCSKMKCVEYLQQPTENVKKAELIYNGT